MVSEFSPLTIDSETGFCGDVRPLVSDIKFQREHGLFITDIRKRSIYK